MLVVVCVLVVIALIIGAIVGLVWGEKAAVLSPFGDLFMNLMFVIIVPLIFLTITTSIKPFSTSDIILLKSGLSKSVPL